MPHKTFFNWSTGKDSAFALYLMQREGNFAVSHLLTSVNAEHNRVSMHGLRRILLEQQAAATGLPLITVELSETPSMAEYEQKFGDAVQSLSAQGFTHAAFGDIFLADLRRYREEKLSPVGIKAAFPLWKRDTAKLIREFLALGFRAVTVSVSADKLGADFVGREVDEAFLADLPSGVDPCGENGEFHTFCYAGPVFAREIGFRIGEKVWRGPKSSNTTVAEHGHWYADLEPL
ncbi:MAG: adenine nucleotide alpha hydrolase [Leptospiraceae bacterium]|nr:adenine nucleotide alpha hydrolase [Leptospiraceae bacterium]